jgi:hypothetical protein
MLTTPVSKKLIILDDQVFSPENPNYKDCMLMKGLDRGCTGLNSLIKD